MVLCILFLFLNFFYESKFNISHWDLNNIRCYMITLLLLFFFILLNINFLINNYLKIQYGNLLSFEIKRHISLINQLYYR